MKYAVPIILLLITVYVFTRKKKTMNEELAEVNFNGKIKRNVKDLTTSLNGIAMIKKHEGLSSLDPVKNKFTTATVPHTTRIYAYQDAVGIWTIGYGHTGTARPGMVITAAEAEKLLVQDLKTAEQAVKRLVTAPITQGMYDALVSFTFNVGSGNLQRSTLLKKINAEQYDAAAQEFRKWNKAGGKVLAGLTTRRIDEQKLFTA